MGTKSVKVKVRQRKRRGPVKGKPRADWETIRRAYVHGTMGLRALCAMFDVPLRTAAHHSSLEDWPHLRQTHQREVATQLQQELREEVLTRKVIQARTLQGIKDRALENLQALVDAGGILKTKDVEALIRLEMDLLDPGWSKSEAEKKGTGTNVNVLVGLETTVLDALRERGLVDAESHPDVIDVTPTAAADSDDLSEAKPDEKVAGYLYGEEGDDGDG